MVADFQMDLPADEGEAGTEFEEEFLDVIDEGLFHFRLAAGISGAEEIEKVGVLENLGGKIRVRRGHGKGEVVLGLARSEVQLALDLHFQNAAAPALGEGFADGIVTGRGVFDHLDEPDEVPPRQL